MMENGDYAVQYGEESYMEQEEEWEREGLLDPAWEKQQKKVSIFLFFLCGYYKCIFNVIGHNTLPEKNVYSALGIFKKSTNIAFLETKIYPVVYLPPDRQFKDSIIFFGK